MKESFRNRARLWVNQMGKSELRGYVLRFFDVYKLGFEGDG
jgi:hypothetical protein